MGKIDDNIIDIFDIQTMVHSSDGEDDMLGIGIGFMIDKKKYTMIMDEIVIEIINKKFNDLKYEYRDQKVITRFFKVGFENENLFETPPIRKNKEDNHVGFKN